MFDSFLATLPVAPKRLFPVSYLSAAAVARRDESEIRGELPFVAESTEVSYFGKQGHCHAGSYAGDGGQQPVATVVAFAPAQLPNSPRCLQQSTADALHLEY